MKHLGHVGLEQDNVRSTHGPLVILASHGTGKVCLRDVVVFFVRSVTHIVDALGTLTSVDDVIVLGVRTDPAPEKTIFNLGCQRTITAADAH
jgi:hypothetical protein